MILATGAAIIAVVILAAWITAGSRNLSDAEIVWCNDNGSEVIHAALELDLSTDRDWVRACKAAFGSR